MLLVAQHHVGDADLAGLDECFAQQRVDLLAATVGGEVVRRVDVEEGDVLGIDERNDIHRLGRLGMGGLDFLIAEHDVMALLVLDTLDDVLAVDLFAGGLVDALVAHAVHAALVQPVEIDSAAAGGRDQGHRDMHQPETDSALPDRTRHGSYSCRRTVSR